jgi:hypothetical protein
LKIIDRPPKDKITKIDRFILNFWRAPSVQTVEFLAGYREDPSPADDRTDFGILHAAYMKIARLSKSCTTLTTEKKSLMIGNAKLNELFSRVRSTGQRP